MPSDSPPTVEERVAELERQNRLRDLSGRRLIRRALVVVSLVVAVSAFGTWRAERAGTRAEQASTRVSAESVERQVAACDSTNEFRRLFRGYLSDQAQGIDPDVAFGLKGFEDLDVPTQEYVRSLVGLVNAGAVDAGVARDEYARQFPVVDCDVLRRTLETEGS